VLLELEAIVKSRFFKFGTIFSVLSVAGNLPAAYCGELSTALGRWAMGSVSVSTLMKGALAATAIALALGGSPAMAAPVSTLSDPTLVGNGITFDNFTCSTVADCTAFGINVDVVGLILSNLQISGAFVAAPGTNADVLIEYDMHAPGGITAVDMFFNGSFTPGLTGLARVTESVFSGALLVANFTVSVAAMSLPRATLRTRHLKSRPIFPSSAVLTPIFTS
jgi:hypothetical protein